MAKDRTYNRLIHTARWLALRKEVLTLHPLCERCLDEGRATAATEVHHVLPVEDALTAFEKERRMYAPTNLRALCHSCHVKTHVEMRKGSREAARQRSERQQEEFRKKFLE